MVNIQLPDALLVKIMLQVTRDALANKARIKNLWFYLL
jgi:hypothetical protein